MRRTKDRPGPAQHAVRDAVSWRAVAVADGEWSHFRVFTRHADGTEYEGGTVNTIEQARSRAAEWYPKALEVNGTPKGDEVSADTAGDDTALTMQVNGIDLPTGRFLELIEQNMGVGIGKAAAAMVADNSVFTDLHAAVQQAERAVRRTLFAQLAEAGVDLADTDEEDWS